MMPTMPTMSENARKRRRRERNRMSKLKRSARLVDMTQYLLANPHRLIPLGTFVDRYRSAKSSISEDLAIIRDVLADRELGELVTVAGAAGGVKYVPKIGEAEARSFIDDVCRQLDQPERILPGGYLYMSDLLGRPEVVGRIGRMFASAFADREPDVVMTVETKGIPIACATAQWLNVPVVIVRRDNRVTEGSSVNINYVSGSSKRIRTMSLARRALKENARVLIVDDFMRAGGTVKGMMDLLQEFSASVQGVGVFVESGDVGEGEHLVTDYLSLAKLAGVDPATKKIRIEPGNYFAKLSEKKGADSVGH